jgi:arylsulfatase A-like enzyme
MLPAVLGSGGTRFVLLCVAWAALLVAARPAAAAVERPPNIVFLLADDLSWDLIPQMPEVRKMQREGLTFDQFVVADSLCCSSRATILTGQFPHNTHVLTNSPPEGGYSAFRNRGARMRSVGLSLQKLGYRTALVGKYLNGYIPYRHGVEPGWNEWFVTNQGYSGFGYTMSDNGKMVRFGHHPRAYLTDVLARRAVRFIHRGRRPFFIKVSSFAPHRPARAAPRHRRRFRDLPLPLGAGFNALTQNPPTWLGLRPPLTPEQFLRVLRNSRQRARSVQALDELIGQVRAKLRREKLADNTYIVFGSDNGYHLGQHRLTFGKRTVFDHDIRVPLVVVGPGVAPSSHTSSLAGTVDLAPTFEDWAGRPRANPRRNGRSLAPLIRGKQPKRWRRALLVEHAHPRLVAGDPDVQGWSMGMPNSYDALRTPNITYVEYENGDREFYDRRTDPAELFNRASTLSPEAQARLSAALDRYRRCRGATKCWSAGRAPGIPPGM